MPPNTRDARRPGLCADIATEIPAAGPALAPVPAAGREITPAEKYLNPQQEAFCQHFVIYNNASVAAAEAGYERRSAHNQGYRLMLRPEIQTRIADIRRVAARVQCLDDEVLLGKLETVYQRAIEDHHFHAAARAVDIQARIAKDAMAKRAGSFKNKQANKKPVKSTACASPADPK